MFSNREMTNKRSDKEYKVPITASSLCACSALPFIEGTVEIDGVTYCEGALVDTVNFESLLEEHPNLKKVFVLPDCRFKASPQTENLHDALANLCQLFAATVGEDDVKLFKYHVRYPRRISIGNHNRRDSRSGSHINFKWNHSNLENGQRRCGKDRVRLR